MSNYLDIAYNQEIPSGIKLGYIMDGVLAVGLYQLGSNLYEYDYHVARTEKIDDVCEDNYEKKRLGEKSRLFGIGTCFYGSVMSALLPSVGRMIVTVGVHGLNLFVLSKRKEQLEKRICYLKERPNENATSQ